MPCKKWDKAIFSSNSIFSLDDIGILENYVVTDHKFGVTSMICQNCRTFRDMYATFWVRNTSVYSINRFTI